MSNIKNNNGFSEKDIKWLEQHGFEFNQGWNAYIRKLSNSPRSNVEIRYSDTRHLFACRISSELDIGARYAKTAESAFHDAYTAYLLVFTDIKLAKEQLAYIAGDTNA